MAIPISTTTITVKGKRPQSPIDPDSEGYDGDMPEDDTLATGVRATITLPQGNRGNRVADEIESYVLRMDNIPEGLNQHDTVVDETDSTEYTVVWAAPSLPTDFGLAHTKAKLQLLHGLNSGGDNDEFARD